jgi:hypothetical protein
MSKFVRRITVVDSSGGDSKVLYGDKKGKKKISDWAKPAERAERHVIQAVQTFGNELVRLHHRSNRKRRDGFIRDAGYNLIKAESKALRKLMRKW